MGRSRSIRGPTYLCCIPPAPFILILLIASAYAQVANRQLQILQLFNIGFCEEFRAENAQVHEAARTFDPLQNLNLYKRPEKVTSFVGQLQAYKNVSLFDPVSDDRSGLFQDIFALYAILWDIDTSTEEGWNLFFNTAAYFRAHINVVAFVWTLSELLSTKFYGQFQSPPYYEMFPQEFAPRELLQEINEGGAGEQYFRRPSTDSMDPESRLWYFREDPSISSFHMSWHIDFPSWWNTQAYGTKDRKGELFLYFHHQVINRYRVERLGNGLESQTPIVIDNNATIGVGYAPKISHINFGQFKARPPNAYFVDSVQDIRTAAIRINDSIISGFFYNSSNSTVPIRGPNTPDNVGNSIVGAALEASWDSINPAYYGSVHNDLHTHTGKITTYTKDNVTYGGIVTFLETSARDPAFYRIHLYVDEVYKLYKNYLEQYTLDELSYPGLEIISVGLYQKGAWRPWANNKEHFEKAAAAATVPLLPSTPPVITTFFEWFTYDVTSGVKNCERVRSGERLTITEKRLNYKPFDYVIKFFSTQSGNAILRVFMSPLNDLNGEPFPGDTLHWNMFELDKFPFVVRQGYNGIIRSSTNSSVTYYSGGDAPSFQELFKQYSGPSGGEKPSRIHRACGYPSNLLIPKGTRGGMKFKMFFMISPTSPGYREEDFPSYSLCGIPKPGAKYPDGKPMGFPFDRRVQFDYPWGTTRNYRYLDVIVKNVGER